jgi:hypothetical protein
MGEFEVGNQMAQAGDSRENNRQEFQPAKRLQASIKERFVNSPAGIIRRSIWTGIRSTNRVLPQQKRLSDQLAREIEFL